MIATGTLIFEGGQLVSWIKDDKETGLVDMVFDTYDKELVLSFEPGCFDAMVKAIKEFQEKRKTTHNPTRCKGRILSDLYLAMENDKRVKMDVNIEEDEERPILNIWSGKEKFELIFSVAQAKEIKRRCEKIIEIDEAQKEVQKSKVVTTRV